MSKAKIYLAGPMVFFIDPVRIFDELKEICDAFGLKGVAPIDGQVDLENIKPGRELYRHIVAADFKLMDQCDGALVCLSPTHGEVEMDSGTAVEIGYLFAKGKPMSGWISDVRPFGERIRDSFGPVLKTNANSSGATSGVERDRNGLLVHSSELSQHGMAQIPIEMTGGTVSASHDYKVAFAEAAKHLAMQLKLS